MRKQLNSQFKLYSALLNTLSKKDKRKIYKLLLCTPIVGLCELSGLIIIYFFTNIFLKKASIGALNDINPSVVIYCVLLTLFLLFVSMKIRLTYLNRVSNAVSYILTPMISKIFAKAYICDWSEKDNNYEKIITSQILSKSREIAILTIVPLFTATLAFVNLVFIVLGMLLYAPLLSFLSILITFFFYFVVANQKLKDYDNLSESNNILLSEMTSLCLTARDNADVDYVNNASKDVYQKLKSSFDNYIKSIARGSYLQGVPRTIMETYGFAFLILLFSIPIIIDSSAYISGIIKSSIIALCFYKLLPLIQALYKNYGYMRFNSKDLEELISLYNLSIPKLEASDRRIALDFLNENIHKKEQLKEDFLEEIIYKLKINTIQDLLRIKLKLGKLILIKGPSGGGKTTMMNKLNLLFNNQIEEVEIGQEKFHPYNNDDYKIIYNKTIRQSKFIYYSCRANFYNLKNFSQKSYNFNLNYLFRNDPKLLNILSFEDYNRSIKRKLSTGQLNRINLAYIFSAKTRNFIFLDEPTANLDSINSSLVAELINYYKDKNCFIVATHDDVFDKIANENINL